MTRRLKHLYADKCFINRMIIENEIKMPLRIGKKRKIFEGKYLVVWEKEFYDKNGIRRTWEYIERIKEIFESNPQYIEKKHFQLVKDFFDACILREKVCGKSQYKDTFPLFTYEFTEESSIALIKAVERLGAEFKEI